MKTYTNNFSKILLIILNALVVILLFFAIFFPVANAEEKPVNIISCRSGTVTMLSATKELTVYAYELKGIDRGAKGNMTFDNFTHRCIGVAKIKAGSDRLTQGYCKYMDPEGDFFIVGWDDFMGKEPLPWEFIQGTGKWEGIQGSGTVKPITRGKPIVEGTFQMCVEVTGTYELPSE